MQAIYHDVLGRAPDSAGMVFWSQILGKEDSAENDDDKAISQTKRRAVAASILQSRESSQDQAQTWYGLFLHRAGDSLGIDALSKALQQGLSDEKAVAVFVGSDEYFARV